MSGKVKVRVLRTFRNKYSKSLHKAGDLLTISPKRLEEINSTRHGQLVELVEETETEPPGQDEQVESESTETDEPENQADKAGSESESEEEATDEESG